MHGRAARRVLLVGWEAADWRHVGALLAEGRLPHLAALVERGVFGPLAAPPPFACPLLWTSMITGVLADRHGILTFLEPDPPGDVRPVSSTSRRRDAVWNLLGDRGLESLVIAWPVTHPAEPVPGLVVSERYPHTTGEAARLWPAGDDAFHPAETAAELRALRVAPDAVTPRQMERFVPDRDGLDPGDPRLREIAAALARAASVQNAAARAMARSGWSFAAVHHDLGGLARGFAVRNGPFPERFRGVAGAAFEVLDFMLGRLVALAGDDTCVIVASDHGVRTGAHAEQGERHGPRTETSGILRRHGRLGVLAAAGPGLREDELVHGARTMDVAPLILAALGLPIPADLDGRVPDGVLAAAAALRPGAGAGPAAPGGGTALGDLHPDPWLARAILEDLGDAVPAASAEAAAALEACAQERHLHRAQILTFRGRFDLALAEYRALLDRDDARQVRFPLVECLLRTGRLDEAEAEIEALPHDAPDSDLALLMRARLNVRRGNRAAAAACLERIAALEPGAIRAPLPIGYLALRLRLWDRAAAFFELALARGGDLDAGAHHGLGVALHRMGRHADALHHHREALRRHPGEARFLLHFGIAAARTGNAGEARSALERARDAAPAGGAIRRWVRRMLPALAPEAGAAGRAPGSAGDQPP